MSEYPLNVTKDLNMVVISIGARICARDNGGWFVFQEGLGIRGRIGLKDTR